MSERARGELASTRAFGLAAQTGFVALGSVGYALPNGLRFELEGDYRSNKWNHASGLGFPGGAGGYEVKYAAMFNALYDFLALIPVPWFAPYAGVGVGYGWARQSSTRFYNNVTGIPRFALVAPKVAAWDHEVTTRSCQRRPRLRSAPR